MARTGTDPLTEESADETIQPVGPEDPQENGEDEAPEEDERE